MFRVKDSDIELGFSIIALVVLLLQVLALLANLGSFAAVAWEEGVFRELISGARPVSVATLRSFQGVVRVQLAFTAIVSVVQVLGLVAFLRMRQRHRASQRSLHRVKLLAHNILASMDQGVITTDRQAVVTSINSAAIRLLGVDFDCVGQPIARISTREVPLDTLRCRDAGDPPTRGERDFTLQRKDGVRRLLASALDLKDTHGETLGSVIHIRDVTERLLMKEQMWRMEQFASLSTLASGLHHEIKNPLTALSIHVQLLDERLHRAAADGPVAELIDVLKAEVRRLNGILESFRNFANLQRLAVRPADVVAILEGVTRLIRPQATQQQVRLTLRRPESALPRVTLDPEKIEQAVLNLVINALEAMPSGGELALGAKVAEGRLQVEVADTGPGIPPEVRGHIFEPYFSTKSRGTGMGLALAEKLIQQHGGHIDVRTGPGGTAFRIDVPLDGKNEVHGVP